MTQSIIDYYNVELQDQKFLDLVASVYKQKVAGTYENIQLEVIGGWYTSPEGQEIQKAERIADAIIKTGV